MEKVQEIADIKALEKNKILGEVSLINSQITFLGENNILFCEDGAVLRNSKIEFNGDNSLVYIGKNKDVLLNVSVFYNSVFAFGKNNYINGNLNVILSEQTNVLIGDECVISFGCWLRTGDPHLIYDVETKKRINLSKSIYMGDHIWLGQNAMLLKNTRVGSGTVIGAMSVVAGKQLISNASYAGNPCKKVRENIFFDGACVHRYQEKETKAHETYKSDKYIYKTDKDTLSFEEIEKKLNSITCAEDKLEYIKDLYRNGGRNRFAVEEKKKHKWLKI